MLMVELGQLYEKQKHSKSHHKITLTIRPWYAHIAQSNCIYVHVVQLYPTNFLTEKSVTSPNELKRSLLSCYRVTHLLILRSTKTKTSLFALFALSLVDGITDAPPKSFVFFQLLPYRNRLLNICERNNVCPFSTIFAPSKSLFYTSRNPRDSLQQKLKQAPHLA